MIGQRLTDQTQAWGHSLLQRETAVQTLMLAQDLGSQREMWIVPTLVVDQTPVAQTLVWQELIAQAQIVRKHFGAAKAKPHRMLAGRMQVQPVADQMHFDQILGLDEH